MTQITRAIDPITTEIIRNFFISCAQDMNVTLIRSAYTPIIYEGKDCSVALLDENGEVLGQSSGLPLFLGNLEICVKLTMEMFGKQVFEPGDVFYMNDPYMQGTHLNDATIGCWSERPRWANGFGQHLPGRLPLRSDQDLFSLSDA